MLGEWIGSAGKWIGWAGEVTFSLAKFVSHLVGRWPRLMELPHLAGRDCPLLGGGRKKIGIFSY